MPSKQIHTPRAIESSILALSLRMIWTRVTYTDTQTNQPYRQRRMLMLQVVTPRRSVIHRHSLGESIMPECGAQLILHGRRFLIQARLQTDHVSRMIIQDRQWIAASLIRCWEPTLEIHLPQLVWSLMLESLPRLVFLRLGRINGSVSLEKCDEPYCLSEAPTHLGSPKRGGSFVLPNSDAPFVPKQSWLPLLFAFVLAIDAVGAIDSSAPSLPPLSTVSTICKMSSH